MIEIEIPSSKSVSARALIANALSKRRAALTNLARCEDTDSLAAAAEALHRAAFAPRSGDEISVWLGDGAASLRFFLAAAAGAGEGRIFNVSFSKQLAQRPIEPLLKALRLLGADIRVVAPGEIRVISRRLKGGRIYVDASMSSQFLSAIMLLAPITDDGIEIALQGKIVSAPYVRMTAAVMRRFGADVSLTPESVRVAPGGYNAPERMDIEADWSAAAFIYEILIIKGLKALREGKSGRDEDWLIRRLAAPDESLQGDAAFALWASPLVSSRFEPEGGLLTLRQEKLRELMGSKRRDEIRLNMSGTPDAVPALAATACALRIPFALEGVAHLRHKESDRIASLSAELKKLGYILDYKDDKLIYDGSRHLDSSEGEIYIDPHGDHRIAMALAPLALLGDHRLRIAERRVVAKSFPGFFELLGRLSEDWNEA